MPKSVSCGVVVVSPAGLLLARATRTSRWDLPKGRIEENETPLDAALREAWEETGLDLKPYRDQFEDLGQHVYIRHKDLHTFRLTLDVPLDLSKCACHTLVELPSGARFPETDRWAWVAADDIQEHVGKGLWTYLLKIGVAGAAPVVTAPMTGP